MTGYPRFGAKGRLYLSWKLPMIALQLEVPIGHFQGGLYVWLARISPLPEIYYI